MNSDVVSVRLLLAVAAISARAAGQQLPPECVPSASGDGVGIIDSGQITYAAANMPYVAPNLNGDPGGNRAENVIDCRWTLHCSDDTLVPRVIFTAFGTENGHDYVRAWDGTPIGNPQVHRIADLHGGRLPDPIVGFRESMTLQFVSDGTGDRWSRGDHFMASFDCTDANPNALPPSHSLRCTMEAHIPSECGGCGGNPPPPPPPPPPTPPGPCNPRLA